MKNFWQIGGLLILSLLVLVIQREKSVTALDFDCTIVSEIPVTECNALLAFYNSTDGPNWVFPWGEWFDTNSPCTSWFGITCTVAGHVTRIDFAEYGLPPVTGLNGPIPAQISDLTHLESLVLGNLPGISDVAAIGSLTNLRELYLFADNLHTLPPELGNLPSLEILSLDSNQLTSLPAEIGNLVNLTTLELDRNQLTSLPAEMDNLDNLMYLYLTANQLASLPPEMGNLDNLASLFLGDNQLLGLPAEIGNLSQLRDLYLNNNQLTSLPPEIGQLTGLLNIHLPHNNLATLPSEFGNLIELTYLDLSHNDLTTLPMEVGNLAKLYSLNVSHNNLNFLPSSLENLSWLWFLDLRWNQLISLPPELGHLPNLITLLLSFNQLSALPATLANLANLTTLDVSHNLLQSFEVGNFTGVTSLNVSHNQLQVFDLGDVTYLQFLDISYNQLSTFPLGSENNSYLSIIYLNHNPMSGPLPVSLTLFNPTDFRFDDTHLCEPTDAAFQDWLSTIPNLQTSGILCIPTTPDVDAWITAPDLVVVEPGGTADLTIEYGNMGEATAVSTTLTISLDTHLLYTSAIPAPTNVTSTTLTWELDELSFYEWSQIWLYTTVPNDAVGTRYPLTMTVSSFGPEAYLKNNWVNTEIIVAKRLFLPLLHK